MTINIYDKDRMLLTGIMLIALIGAIASIGIFFSGKQSIVVNTASDQQLQLLSVSGSASDEFTPDKAEIAFSIVSRGKDPKQIQVENDASFNEILKKLKQLGIPDNDIKTISYSLNKWYEWESTETGGKQVDKGYELRNTVKATSTNVKLAGQILSAVVEGGANQVDYVSFSLSDKAFQQAYVSLLKEATQEAKSKANEMAAAAGVTILKLSRLDEGYSYAPLQKSFDYGVAAAPEAIRSVAVSPGTVQLTVNVNAAYQLN